MLTRGDFCLTSAWPYHEKAGRLSAAGNVWEAPGGGARQPTRFDTLIFRNAQLFFLALHQSTQTLFHKEPMVRSEASRPLCTGVQRILCLEKDTGMLIRQNRTAGIYPSDLDLLKRVFDLLCCDYHCAPGSPVAEAIAIRLVALFEAGVTREEELLAGARPVVPLPRAS